MSDKSEHQKRGGLYGKFCTVPVSGNTCECPEKNDYQENTEKPWGKPYQCHHLAPISSVESTIVGDEQYRPKVEETEWCINKKENMYAMPTWAHTVEYYCRVRVQFYKKRPGFADIPCHLNDHALYNDEVCDRLEIGKDEWPPPHKISPDTIAGLLDTVSIQMKEELIYRGRRAGGTYNAWLEAVEASENKKESTDWYLPFSMALQPVERSFPIKGQSSTVKEWINAISTAMRLK